ncbi:N-acetylglucosamine kinase [Halonatronum saccharophilum]|uniref:N-acetylglucosamine kinase n=1 Tax=Halonatronum saccharophilum TaxID=150060 RepID=UPI0004895E9F|nr:BadF/BadG/BcrA/BcrD ATPase family protein [Halonatronum saccharophilum]
MGYIIGIDAGGSKTLGYLGDDKGNLLALALAGSGNYQSAGLKEVERNFQKIIRDLCKSTEISYEDISIVSIGAAGVDREKDKLIVEEIFSKLGIKAKLLINNDAKTGLVGAHGEEKGIIIISGTGSIAYGIDSHKNFFRVGGWGHLIGDEGSGYYFGRRILEGVMKSYDGREETTTLTDKVMKKLDISSAEGIIDFIYSPDTGKNDVAKLAPLVFEEVKGGDKASQQIVQTGVEELAKIADQIIYKLSPEAKMVNISFLGGLLTNIPLLKDQLRDRIISKHKNIRINPPLFDAGIGALIIGWNDLGVEYDLNYLKERMRVSDSDNGGI